MDAFQLYRTAGSEAAPAGRRLKHAVDFGVADMLARRERHVTLYALHVAGRHAVGGRLR